MASPSAPPVAASISASCSAAENVPQAGVAGAGPDGLSTATACRYMPHFVESPPLATTSFTSAHWADVYVWDTFMPTACVPSPKSQ